jgi:CTP synthase (UTP-ammonia lyase)
VLGLHDAAHQESEPDGSTLVISKLACSLVGQAQQVEIAPGTRAHRAYGVDRSVEQFRCSYGLNPLYREAIGSGPVQVVGVDANGEVRIVELPEHRFHVATLFLPQLSSSPKAPHPLILAYLNAVLSDGDDAVL